MAPHLTPSTPHPFRLVWQDHPVATFESATGLDPWGRLLLNAKEKLMGDVQDSLRSAALPGAPYRDGGTRQKITFERGTIGDPGFEAWAGSQGSEPMDLLIEVLEPDGEVLESYRLRKCSVSTFVGESVPDGPVAVAVLEVGSDGWTWDKPDSAAAAPDAVTGRPSPARGCWKSAVVGGIVGGLIVAIALVPRLPDRQAPPTAFVGGGTPASASDPVAPPKGPRALSGSPDRVPGETPPAPAPSSTSSPASAPARPEPRLSKDAPPVAADDSYEVTWYTTLNVSAPGVLSNDFDPGGNAMTAMLVSPPALGKLVLHPDGSFTYTPPDGYFGPVSFTYRAETATGQSAAATVFIQVDQVIPQ